MTTQKEEHRPAGYRPAPNDIARYLTVGKAGGTERIYLQTWPGPPKGTGTSVATIRRHGIIGLRSVVLF
jgi:hypothetical protein